MILESLVCIALNMYHEARSEDIDAMLAVGHVVMNRVESEKYPDTPCEVVYQAKHDSLGRLLLKQCQFAWYCDGRSDTPRNYEAWRLALVLAAEVMNTADNTNGALWYHADYVQPKWAGNSYVQIGVHRFYNAIREKG
ncbi:MAG: cell wall hydrolase [Pseudohongiellaceae bacterium]